MSHYIEKVFRDRRNSDIASLRITKGHPIPKNAIVKCKEVNSIWYKKRISSRVSRIRGFYWSNDIQYSISHSLDIRMIKSEKFSLATKKKRIENFIKDERW